MLTLILLLVLPIVFLILGLLLYQNALGTVYHLTIQNTTQQELLKSQQEMRLLEQENRLTDVEYHVVKADLLSIVASQSPRPALDRLQVMMADDPKVLKECHGFVHEIGHAAIDRYGDVASALRYQDDLCGSGYIHGIIEEHLAGTPDVFAAMKTLCSRYGLSQQAGKCYHGVGHGLMFYTENDLPEAVSLCNSYREDEARARCAEGIFMENFGSLRALHPSKYLREDDTLYPCSEQPEAFKAACYYYAPLFYLSLHDEDYSGALKSCLNAEKNFQTTCTKGVGSRIAKQHIDDVPFVEAECRKGTKEQFLPCIEGLVSYYLVNFDSVAEARVMCYSLSPAIQKYCLSSVSQQSRLATK